LDYAEILDLSFAYSSNGDGFIEHDKTTGKERELVLHEFPTPEELWNRLNTSKGIDPDQ
jgi:type I restriction enzyme R subunit